jgi:hypothetical protein
VGLKVSSRTVYVYSRLTIFTSGRRRRCAHASLTPYGNRAILMRGLKEKMRQLSHLRAPLSAFD